MGLSLGPVWRPLALVEASTKVAGKLNCLFSPVEKESGMSIWSSHVCVACHLLKVPDLFTVARLPETGSLIAELTPNIRLFNNFAPAAYGYFRNWPSKSLLRFFSVIEVASSVRKLAFKSLSYELFRNWVYETTLAIYPFFFPTCRPVKVFFVIFF